MRLLLLGLLLIGVSLLYFLFREQLGQAFLLGLLGVLAMTGVFYLFGSAVNIIQFAPHGADLELSQAFVDSLPEGTIITDATTATLNLITRFSRLEPANGDTTPQGSPLRNASSASRRGRAGPNAARRAR